MKANIIFFKRANSSLCFYQLLKQTLFFSFQNKTFSHAICFFRRDSDKSNIIARKDEITFNVRVNQLLFIVLLSDLHSPCGHISCPLGSNVIFELNKRENGWKTLKSGGGVFSADSGEPARRRSAVYGTTK